MNVLECPHGCGRKFQEQMKLDEHIQRRHVIQQKQFPSLYENMKLQGIPKKILRPKLPQLNDSQQTLQQSTQFSVQSDTQQQLAQSVIQQLPPKPTQKIKLNQKSILRPSSSKQKITDQQLQKEQFPEQKEITQEKVVTIKEPQPIISTQELMEARKIITSQFVCTNSDGSDIQSVTHLSLNDKNLLIFESTKEVPFSELISLKCLSLSQNRLINIIGISELHNIIDLNINHNKITNLQPLQECKRLQKLYANSNLIDTIDLGLMIHLKVFQIGDNKINDLEYVIQSIQQMPSLKDLVVQNNPCTQKYAYYKYDIIWSVFLDKLDNQIVTQQDYSLAQAFKDSKQESKFSQSMLISKISNRPQTASTNINNEQILDDNSATNNVILESINQELEEEIDELYEINQNMREKIEKLENQNIEYRQIADRVPFLEEQLADMRAKISAYETLVIFKDSPECELRKHIFTLTKELEQLKHSGCQPDEDNNKIQDSSKFQNTQTTFIQQLSQVASDDDNGNQNEDDDDDKYFRDDEDISQVPGQEIMELIMRNSMTLSKLKDEFKGMQ